MKRLTVSVYITPEEADKIIQACVKQRDKLILRTMWETGGRVAEVLSLIPYNVDAGNNCIYLPNLKQNTIRKQRDESEEQYNQRKDELKEWRSHRRELLEAKKAPLMDSDDPPLKAIYLFPESTLCRDLLDYTAETDLDRFDWIFQGLSRAGQVSTTYIWFLLSAIRNPADKWKRRDGLAISQGIIKVKGSIRKPAWPHLFRHGAAMNIYRRTQRLDVTQRQLGHSTIMTTEGYAELMDDDRKTIIDLSEITP